MLPKQREIELPLIKEIARRGGKCAPSEHEGGRTVFEALADFFELTSEDLDQVNEKSDQQSKWENRVRQARRPLVRDGVISNAVLGLWELTDKGKEVAEFIKDVDFTPDSLKKLAGKNTLTTLSEVYDGIIAEGYGKVKALKIVKANDCRSILKILKKD